MPIEAPRADPSPGVAAYCVGRRERTRGNGVDAPGSLPGRHVPAPDPSPDDDGPQTPDGFALGRRPGAPHGAGRNVRGRRRPRDRRHHDVRLPDPRVPRAEQTQLRGARTRCGCSCSCSRPACSCRSSRRSGARSSARLVRGVGGGPVVRRAGLLGGRVRDRCSRRRSSCSPPRRTSCRTSSTVTSGCSCASIVALFTFGIEYLARGAFAGVGPLRRVRPEPRRRGRDPSPAVHPARDRQRHEPGLVRTVPRGAAAARDRHRHVRAARSRHARARRAVVGALEQPRVPARRLVARAGAELRPVPRRAGAGQARPSARSSPTSSSGSSCRASRSCCSKQCRPRCCRSSRRW